MRLQFFSPWPLSTSASRVNVYISISIVICLICTIVICKISHLYYSIHNRDIIYIYYESNEIGGLSMFHLQNKVPLSSPLLWESPGVSCHLGELKTPTDLGQPPGRAPPLLEHQVQKRKKVRRGSESLSPVLWWLSGLGGLGSKSGRSPKPKRY